MTVAIDETPRILCAGLHMTECPRWHEGRLYFSDMYGQTVYATDEAGRLESICRVERRPGGIGFAPGGDLLVNEVETSRILRLRGGRLSVHADLSALAPSGVNDMIVAPSGRCYSGIYSMAMPPVAMPLLTVAPDGRACAASEPLLVANGMALSGDGRTLIVAESAGVRLSAFDVDADGLLSNRRIFAELPPGHYPDGICLDDQGGVWVAAVMGPGVFRVMEGGTITHRLDIAGGRFAYACAIGGAGRDTLFLCTAGPHDIGKLKTETSSRIETIAIPFTGCSP